MFQNSGASSMTYKQRRGHGGVHVIENILKWYKGGMNLLCILWVMACAFGTFQQPYVGLPRGAPPSRPRRRHIWDTFSSSDCCLGPRHLMPASQSSPTRPLGAHRRREPKGALVVYTALLSKAKVPEAFRARMPLSEASGTD
jgi:hypothetical protein